MEIRIRYMNPSTVKKIDEIAKSKGMSRQQFLWNLLENYASSEKLQEMKVHWDEELKKQNQILMENLKMTREIYEVMFYAESE
ncbi:hypothetical protein ABE060_22280 [Bacillus rugosus]|uniref:Ribbon-helix-helix protein CopG domain-containing protein n=2 Tax=Bacillus subtilis TaxID=1423 RepID=B7U595_BACIU|nr:MULTISPECIES: hypothetical protein [Bacillus]ACJ66898.1 hypothetical protein Bsb_18 [Bacillus subtilis]APB62304.1 hypothetical protein pBS72_0350 [Bacillus subtilis]MEC2297178.1 hypothetical protein [Bacillus subtilis]MEC3664940.1 hypothetical protein [Bacillus subtilis]NUF07791.1 hypothetical protein [Bacillus rugosus]